MKKPYINIDDIIGSDDAESAIIRLREVEKKVDFLIWAIREQARARLRDVSGETTHKEPTIH
jgi:hypothetical protein